MTVIDTLTTSVERTNGQMTTKMDSYLRSTAAAAAVGESFIFFLTLKIVGGATFSRLSLPENFSGNFCPRDTQCDPPLTLLPRAILSQDIALGHLISLSCV